MRRTSATRRPEPLNTTVVGAIVILVAVVAVVLSYNASRGLPFVPTIGLSADVPDAARLIAGGSEVRIGGARVGLVQEVTAIRRSGAAPFARVRMTLDPAREGLPVDTRVAIRPRSLLGAKYVELVPGRSKERLKVDAVLPLRQAIAVVEISDTFDILAPKPARALQDGITSLGDALAGRGPALNRTIGEFAGAMSPLQRVLRALAAPTTDLDGFVDGALQVMDVLATERSRLGSLLDGASRTIGALDRAGPALDESITEFARVQDTAVPVLGRLRPVLDDAAAIARGLRPAARRLPRSTAIIATGLAAATPGLLRIPELRPQLERALRSVERVAAAPASGSAVRKLTAAVNAVDSVLGVVAPAQRHCNTVGVFARNGGAIAEEGDENGNWLEFLFMLGDRDSVTQSEHPAPRLHSNPYPRLDDVECEGGNEPFGPGSRIGSPDGIQNGRDETAPPPGVRALAQQAGLLEGPTTGAGR